jgi:hypothetical protein
LEWQLGQKQHPLQENAKRNSCLHSGLVQRTLANHLAHACRDKGWDVLIRDPDAAALKRTKDETYPSRYGAWDPGIRLCVNKECPDEKYDMAIIGTPPEYHYPVAADVYEEKAGACHPYRKAVVHAVT